MRPSRQHRAQGVKGMVDTGQQGHARRRRYLSRDNRGEQASAESLGFYRDGKKAEEGRVERGEDKEGE